MAKSFERQVSFAQSTCGFLWLEGFEVDLLGAYLEGRG